MGDEAYVRAMLAIDGRLERTSQALDAILDTACESPKLRALIDARIAEAMRARSWPTQATSTHRQTYSPDDAADVARVLGPLANTISGQRYLTTAIMKLQEFARAKALEEALVAAEGARAVYNERGGGRNAVEYVATLLRKLAAKGGGR